MHERVWRQILFFLMCKPHYYIGLHTFFYICYFHSNITGLAACLTCPARFHCEGGEGDSKTPIPCPKGHYCPAGTGKSPEKCPAGTYNPQVCLMSLGMSENELTHEFIWTTYMQIIHVKCLFKS